VVVGQPQFLAGTHHAVGFDAADFADFDGERASRRVGGEGGAGQDERDFVAGLEVLGAADDLAFALAVVDAADGEFIGVGMFVAGDDLGDDDAFELAGEFADLLDLGAEHGEPFGEVLG
jgi:hypothetical protein